MKITQGEIRHNKMRIGIDAPSCVKIHRVELMADNSRGGKP
jgi:sRNA-binding carbon storage regulator CsrA